MDPKTGNNQQGNKPRAQGSGSDTVSAANLASGGAGQTAHPGQSATLASHTSKPMGGSQTGSGQSSQGPEHLRHQDKDAGKGLGDQARAGASQAADTARQAAQSAGETVRAAAGQAADTARQAAQSAGETVRDAAGQVQQRAADLYDRAAETAEETYEQASEWARGAYDQGARQFETVRRSLPDVRQYGGSVQRFVNENPVLVGVAGLGGRASSRRAPAAHPARGPGLRPLGGRGPRSRPALRPRHDPARARIRRRGARRRPLRLARYRLAARPALRPLGTLPEPLTRDRAISGAGPERARRFRFTVYGALKIEAATADTVRVHPASPIRLRGLIRRAQGGAGLRLIWGAIAQMQGRGRGSRRPRIANGALSVIAQLVHNRPAPRNRAIPPSFFARSLVRLCGCRRRTAGARGPSAREWSIRACVS